jgi:hypothetical protein
VTTTDLDVADPEVQLYPRLTRFYGLSPKQLMRMPRPLVFLYIDEMVTLAAEDQLVRMQASAYPHMDEDGRNESHDDWMKQMKREGSDEAQVPELARMPVQLAGMGINFVMEGEKKNA